MIRMKQSPARRGAGIRPAAPRVKQPPLLGYGSVEDEKYVALEAAIHGKDRADGPTIAVLVPVLMRPHRVAPLLASFRSATPEGVAKIYFVAQRSDREELAAIAACGETPILVDDDERSWSKKINRGYTSTIEPWILLGADDLAFHAGWTNTISSLLLQFGGVIGTNDLGNAATIRGQGSTHPLVRRAYADIFGTADEIGKVVHAGYDHNFPDAELVVTARRRALFTHARNCIIEHLHPLWRKAPQDHVYQLGRRNWKADQALYVQRCKQFGLV